MRLQAVLGPTFQVRLMLRRNMLWRPGSLSQPLQVHILNMFVWVHSTVYVFFGCPTGSRECCQCHGKPSQSPSSYGDSWGEATRT